MTGEGGGVMKPDWKDAPKWAQWLAQDDCGDWWWFANRPRPISTIWYSPQFSEMHREPCDGDWRETLEKRP